MRSPSRVVSVWTVVSLIAHSLMVMALSPSPAYAVTLDEAKAASGWIGAGELHSLARTTAGTAIAWGDESDGRTSLSGTGGVARVAAGDEHSLMLMSDGTVVAVGSDTYGQCQVPEDLAGVIAIAAGGQHSLALRDDDTVVAWGANGFGQSTVPPTLTDVVAISAGWNHSLALKSNGTVVAWGANGSGQSSVPPTLTNVVAIAAGGLHSLALRSDGTVTGWGDNTVGQRTPPSGLSDTRAISAGWNHSLALKSDGTVVAWGANGGGQSTVPSALANPTLANVVAISAGWRHSLALRSDGTPVGWGSNSSGQSLGPVSIDPAPSSKGVPTDVVFRIAYSAPIKAGAAYAQVRLEDSQGIPVVTDKTIDGTLLTVTPSAALLTDERYFLRVPAGSLVDDYGNSIVGGIYSYDTPDTIPPTVVSVSPVDGAEGVSVYTLVSVEFSERIALGPSADEVTLLSGSGHAVECRYSTLGSRLQIKPLDTLDPETSYTLTVPAAAVTDLSGNPLAAQFTSSFTTGERPTAVVQHDAGGVVFDRWVTGYSTAYSGGGYVYGRWNGTEITARFTGSKIRWIGPKQPSYGMADVYIDGVLVGQNVDCYAPTGSGTLETLIWESETLSNGPHTISIRLKGNRNPLSSGNIVVLDRFEVEGPSPKGGGTRVDDAAAAPGYTGSWISAINPTYYDKTYSYSRWAGHVFAVTFTGTKVAWIGPKTPFYGKAEIWLDDEYVATIDAYRENQGWRERIWESDTLDRGPHTLEIRPTGTKNHASASANIVIDAIDVTP